MSKILACESLCVNSLLVRAWKNYTSPSYVELQNGYPDGSIRKIQLRYELIKDTVDHVRTSTLFQTIYCSVLFTKVFCHTGLS